MIDLLLATYKTTVNDINVNFSVTVFNNCSVHALYLIKHFKGIPKQLKCWRQSTPSNVLDEKKTCGWSARDGGACITTHLYFILLWKKLP